MTVSVYVIGREEGPVKIGITLNPRARLAALQTCCPFKIKLFATLKYRSRVAAKAREQELHKVAKPWRLYGEWFDIPAKHVADTFRTIRELEA